MPEMMILILLHELMLKYCRVSDAD